MEKYAQDTDVHSIYTGTMPWVSDQEDAQQPGSNTTDGTATTAAHADRKKYHSSALYAASKWHSPVGHVRATHRGLDL